MSLRPLLDSVIHQKDSQNSEKLAYSQLQLIVVNRNPLKSAKIKGIRQIPGETAANFQSSSPRGVMPTTFNPPSKYA